MRLLVIISIAMCLGSCQALMQDQDNKPYVKETYTVVRYSDATPKDSCHMEDIHLKDNMPKLPEIPKSMTRDNEVGEITLAHMVELRNYIKEKDKEIQDRLAHCK